jgi:glycerol-3-phosphate O-acyltransferase
VLRALHQFRVRLDRYKLVRRRTVRDALLADTEVLQAIEQHTREQGSTLADGRANVERYVDEIIPYFNVLSYYRLGYNLARLLIRVLYRADYNYVDEDRLKNIPRDHVVVYLMNHRSNADYVVVAYVLAKAVSISYAVGEWARVWPLEYVFKSFGAYFIRRGFRDPLYHTVLRRYVQHITRHGITQGIFLEGGLSRDGAFRPAKVGLLDYITRTLPEFRPDQDIHLVPVALNYDRVLEDRTLIHELLERDVRPGRFRQLSTVVQYVLFNLGRLVTGNLKRYGRVHVTFGAPVSLREWAGAHHGVFELDKAERLPVMQALADNIMQEVAQIVPVTPVPLVAAALLSFEETVVGRGALLERIDEFRDDLMARGANLVQPERGAEAILDRAWRMLSMRRLVVRQGAAYVMLPRQRPLLHYYANSIAHLLPTVELAASMHPAREPDATLPRLKRWSASQRGPARDRPNT